MKKIGFHRLPKRQCWVSLGSVLTQTSCNETSHRDPEVLRKDRHLIRAAQCVSRWGPGACFIHPSVSRPEQSTSYTVGFVHVFDTQTHFSNMLSVLQWHQNSNPEPSGVHAPTVPALSMSSSTDAFRKTFYIMTQQKRTHTNSTHGKPKFHEIIFVSNLCDGPFCLLWYCFLFHYLKCHILRPLNWFLNRIIASLRNNGFLNAIIIGSNFIQHVEQPCTQPRCRITRSCSR